MDPRAGLDGRKISSPPGFDPGPSSPQSVAMPTNLPGPLSIVGYIKVTRELLVFVIEIFVDYSNCFPKFCFHI